MALGNWHVGRPTCVGKSPKQPVSDRGVFLKRPSPLIYLANGTAHLNEQKVNGLHVEQREKGSGRGNRARSELRSKADVSKLDSGIVKVARKTPNFDFRGINPQGGVISCNRGQI